MSQKFLKKTKNPHVPLQFSPDAGITENCPPTLVDGRKIIRIQINI